MGLFQGIADFYDYKYVYYRSYLRRRIMFREEITDLNKPAEGLFGNKDYENFDLIIRKSIKYFFVGGVAYSTWTSAPLIYGPEKRSISYALTRGGILSALSAVVGLLYATTVYSVANLRKKDGAGNHMLASAVTMPLFSIFAKQEKLQAALCLAIYPAILIGAFKLFGSGQLDYKEFKNNNTLSEAERKKNYVMYTNPVGYRGEFHGMK